MKNWLASVRCLKKLSLNLLFKMIWTPVSIGRKIILVNNDSEDLISSVL